jgi:NAD(P)-dependent dehydrogenase (short-subunit alcohol dehydrogenase family)
VQIQDPEILLFQELSGTLKTASGKLYAVKCDVTNEANVKEAFKWIKTNLGGVDILINNAGGDSSNTLIGKSRSST